MYTRLYSFLQDLKVLYEFQFGFRQNHSTYMALITSVDKIISALNNGDFVIGIFLDFSKAFDTIDHNILLEKLENYGIRGVAHKWFHNYLYDRYQYVNYANVSSNKRKIVCGVPQGSILGPLLFLLYINDLASACPELFAVMYADDSNMFKQGRCLKILESVVNTSLCKVSKWLKLNKLSLNIDKTHFMIFKGRKQRLNYSPEICIDNKPISQVPYSKFLGVYIDENLLWNVHIENISKKISKGIGILNKAQKCLNQTTLHQLYYTFIYPYISYCNHVWGNTFKKYLKKIELLQKRIIRLITFSKFKANTSELFKDLKILKCHEIHTYLISQFLYRYRNNLLPSSFKNQFIINHDVHNYNTRSQDKFHIGKFKTEVGKRFLTYYGIVKWNSFIDALGICKSLEIFKSRLKHYLLHDQT